MALSDGELARIRAAFDECSRRLSEQSVQIRNLTEIVGTQTEQIQRLKNAVANVMAKVG